MTAFMSLTSIFNCLAINRAGNNNLEAAAKTTLDSFLFRSKEPIKRQSESTKLITSLNFLSRKSCNFVASVRCFRSLSRFRGNQPHLISKSNPAVFLNAWMQKTIQISSLAQLKSSRDQVLAQEMDLSKLIKNSWNRKAKNQKQSKSRWAKAVPKQWTKLIRRASVPCHSSLDHHSTLVCTITTVLLFSITTVPQLLTPQSVSLCLGYNMTKQLHCIDLRCSELHCIALQCIAMYSIVVWWQKRCDSPHQNTVALSLTKANL